MFIDFQQWPLFLAVGIAMVNIEQIGILVGWTSPVLLRLQGPNSPIPLTSSEGSWLASLPSMVSMVCTPLAALSMNYLGRKLSIVITIIPCLVHWALISIATSTTELLIARAIFGIGSAFTYTVVPIYLGEIAPDNIRAGIGTAMNAVGHLGTLWVYWVGTYPDLWVSSVVCAFPLVFVIVFAKWLPESPYYLVEKNRKEEAKQALKKLRNMDKIDDEFSKIEESMNIDKSTNSFKKLITEVSHRRALLICTGVFTIAQLTGGMTFLFYAHIIFEKAGNVSANMMTMIKATLQFFTAVGAVYVVDNVGKKPLLIISCIGSSVFMSCEGTYFYLLDNGYNVDNIWWLPLISMILFNIFQVIGLSSISFSYLGELFHPKVKSLAVCISKSYLSFLVFMVGKLFQILMDSFGNYVPFFMFAVIGVLGVFFIVIVVPETKGRSFEEIQYYMKHKTYNKDL